MVFGTMLQFRVSGVNVATERWFSIWNVAGVPSMFDSIPTAEITRLLNDCDPRMHAAGGILSRTNRTHRTGCGTQNAS